ncbi:TspO/MBR family protein [Haloferula rosea]|uniref:Tryptophan-rich sensory protein n=1 Tax=Haloferula rosea TaxID=490093 RepID=A0A934RB57_9BACT|nr:TspO/MBR family protein [Haloferula rosea]MBK1828449.1 tryptophan-rich sensory protein [Haloferula rosea]
MKLWQKIVVCVLVIEGLGSLSGLLTASSIRGWFATLDQPPGNPPNWVFGPVWTLLYAMMGTAIALIWHRAKAGPNRTKAITLFISQFALNLAWTPVFFGAHQIAMALVVIVTMALGILLTIFAFHRIDRLASRLLIPYFCWVGYATYLNAGYLYLNR